MGHKNGKAFSVPIVQNLPYDIWDRKQRIVPVSQTPLNEYKKRVPTLANKAF